MERTGEEQYVYAETSLGTIRGIYDQGNCCWRGIPYAKPITPERRFAPPEPIDAWKETLDATRFSSISPQKSLLWRNFGEDCLTLNIWTPSPDRKGRPVLFFIHGGSLIRGAGSESLYDGAKLARTWDTVVVTCNYRLGILGFSDFTHLDSGFARNCGLKDILSALRWVSNEIAAFGGEASNCTVIGQSAGGTIVSALAVMPEAKPLISRCIIMSGGPTQLQGIDDCRSTSEQFLAFSQMAKPSDLIHLSLSELVKAQKAFIDYTGLGSATFRLTVDGQQVPDYPIPAARRGMAEGIPLLIGTTQEEMSFMNLRPLERVIDVRSIVDIGLQLESNETKDRLIEGYITHYGEEHGRSMLYTDLLFRISSIWFAEAATEHSKDVWMYRFDYEPTLLRKNGLHAFHATDLPYLFGNFDSVIVKPMFLLKRDMKEVLAIAHELQQDLVSFSQTGELSWEKCSPFSFPAKCYDLSASIQPCVPDAILRLYQNSEYRTRSFSSGINPAPVILPTDDELEP
ncbi:MAG: carboxylesterase/lipase family protein [Spirochaetota bacterium]